MLMDSEGQGAGHDTAEMTCVSIWGLSEDSSKAGGKNPWKTPSLPV